MLSHLTVEQFRGFDLEVQKARDIKTAPEWFRTVSEWFQNGSRGITEWLVPEWFVPE